MKLEAPIVIKNKQICNQQGELINLRGFTIDTFLTPTKEIPECFCSLDENDPDCTFDDIKRRGCGMIRWNLYWSIIEPEEGRFNEEYLAKLRDYVKLAHKAGLLVYFVPLLSVGKKPFWGTNTYPADKIIDDESAGMYYVNLFSDAMNHAARRLKDCENVIGFSIPQCYEELMNAPVDSDTLSVLITQFIDLLHKKHTQYFFLCETAELYDDAMKNKKESQVNGILASIFLENNHVMLTC